MDMEQKTMKYNVVEIGRNAKWYRDTGEVRLLNGSTHRPDRMLLGFAGDLLSAKDLVHHYANGLLGF